MSDLAKVLVMDYSDLGLAIQETETSLRSLDGEMLVEFEPIASLGEATDALAVFVNGVAVDTLLYDDRGFSSKLIALISGPLNF